MKADIIWVGDFIAGAREVMGLERAIMIGARTDVTVNAPVDFDDPAWESRLRSEALTHGAPMTISSDYFLFRRGFYDPLPPFLVGRPAYDNWMIWRARAAGATVIDASHAVLAVHQKHSHTMSWANTQDQSENQANRELAGRWRGTYSLQDANAF